MLFQLFLVFLYSLFGGLIGYFAHSHIKRLYFRICSRDISEIIEAARSSINTAELVCRGCPLPPSAYQEKVFAELAEGRCRIDLCAELCVRCKAGKDLEG